MASGAALVVWEKLDQTVLFRTASSACHRWLRLTEWTPLAACQKGREGLMTHVVCKPCYDCKYTDCVVVCPVECFYEGERMLYIHPDDCIDCEACVPECPVDAIFLDENVPEEWHEYIALNAEMAPQCEVITEKKEPLAEG
jgi:ferredoxin